MTGPGNPARRRAPAMAAALAAALTWLIGCGPQFGAFLYFFRLYPKQKVAAEFKLPSGRMLVLIDDDSDVLRLPEVPKKLTEGIAHNLLDNGVKTTVIPFEQIKTLQQHEPDFETMAADRVGKALEADHVLWIKVDRFSTGSLGASDVSKAATFAVNLRLLSTWANSRDEVQLWPQTREPKSMATYLTLAVVQEKNDPRVIAEMLTETLAAEIAKLFYEHELEEPT